MCCHIEFAKTKWRNESPSISPSLSLSSVSFCVAQRDYKRQEEQQQLVGLVEIACTRLDLKEEEGRAKGLQRLQGVQLDRDRESAYEREREQFVCVCETKSKAQEQFKCVTEKRQTKQRVEEDKESINVITERGEEEKQRVTEGGREREGRQRELEASQEYRTQT